MTWVGIGREGTVSHCSRLCVLDMCFFFCNKWEDGGLISLMSQKVIKSTKFVYSLRHGTITYIALGDMAEEAI